MMNGKQIIGILLLLLGAYLTLAGGSNILDLINYGNNPLLQLGLQAQGTSIGAMWLKFGVMTIVGVALLLFGFKLVKKPQVETAKN